jgi:hypothetical protein
MTALLDPAIADLLAKVCGMFGSDHAGERAAAAAMANKLVRTQGLTWSEIIVPMSSTPTSPRSIEEQIDFALSYKEVLSAWDWGFVNGIRGRQFLTEKQLAKLGDIVAKVRAYAEAAQ